ncbi:MAG: pentapeptide repeat-containing protein [Rickettsiales bacterium]|nr:pentapeptide repeat-containing protein [Rickettsiales bacterium]
MTENLRSSLQQYVTLHWKLFNEVLSINELDVSKWLEDTYGTKNLRHMDLRGFDFSYANLDGVDFSGSDLLGINLRGASLKNANFQGATLMGALLDQAKMSYCNFTDTDLRGASIYNTDFESSNFKNANMNDLRNTQKCVFKGANLEDICFKSLNLEHTNFKKANLRGCNLENADLQYACLEEANISGASLKSANLSKAEISYIKGVTLDQLSETLCIFSAYTDDEDQQTNDLLDALEAQTTPSKDIAFLDEELAMDESQPLMNA